MKSDKIMFTAFLAGLVYIMAIFGLDQKAGGYEARQTLSETR